MSLCRNGWCRNQKEQAEPHKIQPEDLLNCKSSPSCSPGNADLRSEDLHISVHCVEMFSSMTLYWFFIPMFLGFWQLNKNSHCLCFSPGKRKMLSFVCYQKDTSYSFRITCRKLDKSCSVKNKRLSEEVSGAAILIFRTFKFTGGLLCYFSLPYVLNMHQMPWIQNGQHMGDESVDYWASWWVYRRDIASVFSLSLMVNDRSK